MPLQQRWMSMLLLCLLPLAAASGELGAKIAQQGTPAGVAPCMACHGSDGSGQEATAYPRLAGLDAAYLAMQLRAFRSGQRAQAVMSAMAQNLTDEQIDAVSSYYAALPAPPDAAVALSDTQARRAAELAQWGDLSGRGLPACASCHAADGAGIGRHFPALSGQRASYLKAQLQAWQNGARSNDPLGLMQAVAERLSAAEIEALAAYYAAGANVAALADAAPAPAATDVGKRAGFMPPPRAALPAGPLGDAARQGEAIFSRTASHPLSAPYVGNRQACGNCHLDAGRLAGAAPLWAAWVAYPAYRKKNAKVNTFIERVQGCFTYSMNAPASATGVAPAADSDVMLALQAYSYWLATGAPTGDTQMPGRGFPRLAPPGQGFDPQRGAQVYAEKCALCHGEQGEGISDAGGNRLFPPLWGAQAYNWGAGMHKIDAAAAFIQRNMPLGLGNTLSDQQAWDVAAFVNSHERPQDPRHQGDLAVTTQRFHGGAMDYYGQRQSAAGHLLGARPAIP